MKISAIGRRFVFAAIFCIAFATYLTRVNTGDALRQPPEAGDGHDYDAIAFNVWHGRGFGYEWSNEEWRKPYEGIPRYRLLLTRQSEFYPTTYRPPAMPYLLALVYAVTDRSFAAWRVVNCAITAGAITAAAAMSAELGGLAAAVLAAGIALQSRELTRYSGMFMTESLATFMAAMLAWAWIRNATLGWTSSRAVASGAVFGGLIASRTLFVLWTPVVLLLGGRDLSFHSRFAWRPKALCLAVALLVMTPWFVRNIIVTRAFMPLGTQGGINLPMGFGPRAFRSHGIWASNPVDGWPEIAAQKLDVVTSEVLLAKYRSKLTIGWMLEHPADVLELMRLHLWQEIRPRGDRFANWLLPLAGVSILVLRKLPGVWVLALMIGANMLSIAMTYSASGRFMVPIQPLLIAPIAAMLAVTARRALEWRRQPAPARPPGG